MAIFKDLNLENDVKPLLEAVGRLVDKQITKSASAQEKNVWCDVVCAGGCEVICQVTHVPYAVGAAGGRVIAKDI